MFKFKIIEKYWIDKNSDDPEDLCAHGLNYEIRNLDNMIIITNESKESVSITNTDYKNNILSFVNEVENFYTQSSSKIVSSEDVDGYDSFWNEWHYLKKMHY